MSVRPRMKELSDEERKSGFDEVEKGLALHQALPEASRCLFCHDAPCVSGCVAGIDVVGFIRRLKTRNFIGAARLAREANVFSAAVSYTHLDVYKRQLERVEPGDVLMLAGCQGMDFGGQIALELLWRDVYKRQIQGSR